MTLYYAAAGVAHLAVTRLRVGQSTIRIPDFYLLEIVKTGSGIQPTFC
jgi:hypothetical protein